MNFQNSEKSEAVIETQCAKHLSGMLQDAERGIQDCEKVCEIVNSIPF